MVSLGALKLCLKLLCLVCLKTLFEAFLDFIVLFVTVFFTLLLWPKDLSFVMFCFVCVCGLPVGPFFGGNRRHCVR